MNLYFTGIQAPPDQVVKSMETKGWCCRHMAFRQVVYLAANLPSVDAGHGAWLITSPRAARWLLDQNPQKTPPIAAVGQTTHDLLTGFPLVFSQDPPRDAASLGERLQECFEAETRFLFIRGAAARDVLVEALGENRLDILTVYRTEKRTKIDTPYLGGMVYFQAPSTVWDFQEIYGRPPQLVGVIGPATADAVRKLGWRVHFQPSRPELPGLIFEMPGPETFLKNSGHT